MICIRINLDHQSCSKLCIMQSPSAIGATTVVLLWKRMILWLIRSRIYIKETIFFHTKTHPPFIPSILDIISFPEISLDYQSLRLAITPAKNEILHPPPSLSHRQHLCRQRSRVLAPCTRTRSRCALGSTRPRCDECFAFRGTQSQ